MRDVRLTDLGWEGRCEACLVWLPLDEDSRDVWPVKGRGLRICRACDNLKTAERNRKRREDPEVRAREYASHREYLASMTLEQRRAMRRSHIIDLDRSREYRRLWMQRKRAAMRAAS